LTKSRRVRALVVRVDSPGGSALASDVMWRELCVAAAKKPVFVSMVNVAASGGYFTSGIKGVSIWASPTTLTGSIGVVGGKFEISGLLEKLGIKREAVNSGPRAGFHSPAQPWTPADLAKVERDIEASYRDFVGKMAEARGMSFDELHAVAQGRVWTGRQAQNVKLVDHLGGLYEVERAVRERLALAPGTRLRFTVPASERTLRGGHDADAESLLDSLLSAFPDVRQAIEPALDLSHDRLWALSLIQPRLPG
jgi:protease-4